MKECPRCKYACSNVAIDCPVCHLTFMQAVFRSSQITQRGNLNTLLGIIGSLILVLGVFSPLFSVPVMGSVNYFQNGKGDGVIVLILAVVSLLLSVARQFRSLWLTGLTSAVLLTLTFVSFQINFERMKSEINTRLADNPFAGLANLATEAVQMQWGWAVLISGTLLILVAAAFKPQR
jgi:hypothetical protein